MAWCSLQRHYEALYAISQNLAEPEPPVPGAHADAEGGEYFTILIARLHHWLPAELFNLFEVVLATFAFGRLL